MKKIVCILVISLLISTMFFSTYSYANVETVTGKNENKIKVSSLDQYGNGYRYNIQGWIYTYIEGYPYERGYQYGVLLAEEIVDLMTRWSNMIHNHPLIKPFNGCFSEEKYQKISSIWWNFCKSQITRIYWDKFPDEYKEEIKGMANGVNSTGLKLHGKDVSYKDVLTSNMMYEFLSKLTYRRIIKGFHPLLTLLKNLKEETPELSKVKTREFIKDFVDQPMHHKCNGFIATGDATTNGQIVISNSMWSTGAGTGMWWWSYYLTFRWNIVLDINPTDGNRVIMASAPGYIWSDHDFYQNDNGIVFLETTNPQGLWDNKGLPLAVRARKAVQYANSIDDVMYYLKHRNDGCMNAVWLIGDIKTGEIARFELGYRHSWFNKTFNGFHWSANNPMDFKVRLEKLHLRDMTKDFIKYILGKGTIMYYFPKYRPSNRDRAFEELGNQYYGKIDIDIVKKIMSTEPITNWSPDCKVTDSSLVENNGLWAIIGSPDGRIMEFENLDENKIKVDKIPPVGWVRIYGLPEKNEYETISNSRELEGQPEILWTYETEDNSNTFYSSSVIVDDVLYSTTSTGEIYALHSENGSVMWNMTVGDRPTAPTIHDDQIFIGTIDGLKIIDLNWMIQGVKPLGKILSPPVVADGKVFVGNENGDVYALNIESGDIVWSTSLPDEIYISNPWNDYLFIGSDKNCYKMHVETGDILWVFETNGIVTSRPYVNNDVVYFGSWDTYVSAVNANDGSLIWEYETGWGIETTPVLSDELVFIGSHDNNFYALNKNNGSLNWVFTCKAGIHPSPIVSNNCVLFGSDDGRFYCLNKTDSNVIWNFSPGFTIDDKTNYITTPIISTSAVYEDIVYIGVEGTIYALSL